MTNRRSQNCESCGEIVAAGCGTLHQSIDDDDEYPRWIVKCVNVAVCRARVIAARAAVTAAVERRARLETLRALFTDATAPRSAGGEKIVLDGELIELDDCENRIHGGGIWAVIETGWIWLVRGNGGDGDTWSVNNIHTQGAGAIGVALRRTAELEAAVRGVVG